MATVITGFTVSLVLGVPIGTFLSGHVDWHYIFLIIALGTVCLFLLLYQLLPRIEGHSHLPLKQQLHILQDRRVISGLATTPLDFRLHDGLCLYLSFITTDRWLFT